MTAYWAEYGRDNLALDAWQSLMVSSIILWTLNFRSPSDLSKCLKLLISIETF